MNEQKALADKDRQLPLVSAVIFSSDAEVAPKWKQKDAVSNRRRRRHRVGWDTCEKLRDWTQTIKYIRSRMNAVKLYMCPLCSMTWGWIQFEIVLGSDAGESLAWNVLLCSTWDESRGDVADDHETTPWSRWTEREKKKKNGEESCQMRVETSFSFMQMSAHAHSYSPPTKGVTVLASAASVIASRLKQIRED